MTPSNLVSSTADSAGDPNVTRYLSRQERLAGALREAGLDLLALNPGASLRYLTGWQFHLSERPVVAIFGPSPRVTIILPELEAGKLEDSSFEVTHFTYGEDPHRWSQVFQEALAGWRGSRVGIEPLRLRVLELSLLKTALVDSRFIPAEDALHVLRMVKDDTEVTAMHTAVTIAQNALEATLARIQIGMRESELASELTMQLLRHGSHPELPFAPIVASGPNSANPHASPGDRQLQAGDLLLMDWGASFGGYVSDLTRTFSVGQIDPELDRLARVVREANSAAQEVARPGVPAEEVDQAAREVIAQAGYGEAFIHRTGHGLGMEVHEPPYIREGNRLELAPGMTFTIEPGVYLPGRAGIRIEDDFLVTSDSGESLSDLPRELRQVG